MDQRISHNTKARFHYEIVETLEVGIVLKGCEIRSIRSFSLALDTSWIQIEAKELWLRALFVPPYPQASFDLPDPRRSRKLLAKKSQIRSFQQECERKGMTIVPLKLYFVKGRAKLLIGLARGKNYCDKREEIKKREETRSMARALKQNG